MLPTFAQLTGVKEKNCIDGISLMPLLKGKGKQKEHEHFYFEFHEGGGRQALRKPAPNPDEAGEGACLQAGKGKMK